MMFKIWVLPVLPAFLTFTLVTGALQHTAAQEDSEQEPPASKALKDSGEDKAKKKPNRKAAKAKSKKKAITPADYGQWERLLDHTFSANGRWLTYEIVRVDENRSLTLHSLKSKRFKPAATYEQGSQPVFSEDSAWLAVTIKKSPADLKKEKKAGDKAPKSAGRTMKLRRLKDGETTEFKNVGSFSFSADSRYAALEILPKASGTSKPKTPTPGEVLIIRELANGQDTTFGNVVRHEWSGHGSLLAMVIDSPSISNSLQVFNPAKGTLRTLASNEEDFTALVWREDAMDLAAMREVKHEEKEDVSHVLLAWRNLNTNKPTAFSYKPAEEKNFPKEMYLTSSRISWSKDGKSILCDLKEWENQPKKETKEDKKNSEEEEAKDEPKKDEKVKPKPKTQTKNSDKKRDEESKQAKPLRETLEENSNVEIWHSKDVDIMPLQKKKAQELKNPKRKSIWWLDTGKLVQLGNELTERVGVLRAGTHAVGMDYTPHERTSMFGPKLYDLYLIDTTTGERENIEKGIKEQMASSPNGRYLLYLREGDVWSYDVESDQKQNLTEDLETHFTNQEDDTLTREKDPYGEAVWLTDSSAVLLYDRFDIWKIAPDGSAASKLTEGAGEMIRHRLSRASFRKDDKRAINPKNPLLIALYGERTKKSGYGQLRLNGDAENPNKLETFIWEDRAVSSLTRAEGANVFAFVQEDSNDSPDLYLGRGKLRKTRKLTNTNSFQKDFLWGRSELVDYKNQNGVPLQGALTYPANYVPGRKYPMIVYIYEERSQQLHRYSIPSEEHPYNPAVYSAEGYFVFQPDIVYRPQEPGISAVECVIPAVEKVLESGMIDEDGVGLIGHSWGAYQTAFIVTRSDIFAAGIAGAPLTDMMSMATSVYWNSGQPNARIFAQSQGRMDHPFWRDVDNYVRNSPIHGLDKLNTPLLMAFGDKDGAVDWGQGVQMYNAARWAGKDDVVMLVYPGENHSLRKKENRIDYHYRVLEWFGHYLQKKDAQKWITEGKSYLERQQELEDKKDKEKKTKEKDSQSKEDSSKDEAKSEAKTPKKKKPAPKKRKTPKKEAEAAEKTTK